MSVTKCYRRSLQRRKFKRKFWEFLGLYLCVEFYLSFIYRFMCLVYTVLVPCSKGENIYIKGPTKFQRNLGFFPPNSVRQKDEIRRATTPRPTILKWPLNITIIRRFLFGACVTIRIFVCKGRPQWCSRRKCSWAGDQPPEISGPLIYTPTKLDTFITCRNV